MKKSNLLTKESLLERFKLLIQYNKQNKQLDKIVSGMQTIKKGYFIPTMYLLNGLLQTAFNALSNPSQVNYTRQYIQLQDGGQISVDWAKPIRIQKNNKGQEVEIEYEPSEDNKILFIVHGLTGGSNMSYIQYLCYIGQKAGFLVAAFNSRGVNTQMTSPLPSDGAVLTDLNIALLYVKNKYPKSSMFAAGTSFGGNQLVRWVGEYTKEHGSCFLKGIAGFSVPFDTERVINNMGKVYHYVLADYYKKHLVLPHMDQLSKLSETHQINWTDVQQANNLHTLYNLTAVKIFGYKNIHDLFDKLSVKSEHIENINIPTLLIHSKDDPMVSIQSVPIDKFQQNPNIVYIQTSIGGHVCWFYGKNPKRWYPEPTVDFFNQILANEENQHKLDEQHLNKQQVQQTINSQ